MHRNNTEQGNTSAVYLNGFVSIQHKSQSTHRSPCTNRPQRENSTNARQSRNKKAIVVRLRYHESHLPKNITCHHIQQASTERNPIAPSKRAYTSRQRVKGNMIHGLTPQPCKEATPHHPTTHPLTQTTKPTKTKKDKVS